MPIPQISDTIQLSNSDGGNANAGNGGDGYSYGDIHYNPVAYVAKTQAVEGAYTDMHTGDKVWQDAVWDAGAVEMVDLPRHKTACLLRSQ
ncbi:hypothetical protein N8E89_19410 (plasmid) [Phyllobacterium sp. A18/5-2]|nr:hypothetical protein N8E89_19410 [Phyllobacterium sp. A18/5-2]